MFRSDLRAHARAGLLVLFLLAAGLAFTTGENRLAAQSPEESPEPPMDLPEDELWRLASTPAWDCNANGIPDETDIELGYADDVNHDGFIDDCQNDEKVPAASRADAGWWRAADVADSIYFSVRHTEWLRVRIRYTLPPMNDLWHVDLTVLYESGDLVTTLVRENQPNGVYALEWDRKVSGADLPAGTYTFRLVTGALRAERGGGANELVAGTPISPGRTTWCSSRKKTGTWATSMSSSICALPVRSAARV